MDFNTFRKKSKEGEKEKKKPGATLSVSQFSELAKVQPARPGLTERAASTGYFTEAGARAASTTSSKPTTTVQPTTSTSILPTKIDSTTLDGLTARRDELKKERASVASEYTLLRAQELDNTMTGTFSTRFKTSSEAKSVLDQIDAELNNIGAQYYNMKSQVAKKSLLEDKPAYQSKKSIDEIMADISRLDTEIQKMEAMDKEGSFNTSQIRNELSKKYGLTGKNYTAYTFREELKKKADEAKAALKDAGHDYDAIKEYDQRFADEAKASKAEEATREFASQRPVLASAASVVAAPLQGIDYAGALLKGIGHSDTDKLDEYVPLNSYKMLATNFVSNTRDQVSKDIEKNTDWEIAGQNIASFLYNTGMSIADSTAQIATLGPASTVLMGASAAANQAKKIIDQGGTNAQALWSGLAAGAAEAIFEKFSVDNLLKTKTIGDVKSLLRETLKQAGTEASEEVLTEVSNILSDVAIMGDSSDFAKMVAAYMEDGYSEEEARKKAIYDCIGQVVWAGIGGAISGGVMGGVKSTSDMVKTQNLGRGIKTGAVANVNQFGEVQKASENTESKEAQKLAKKAQKELEKTGKISDGTVGQLVQQNAQDLQELIKLAAESDNAEVQSVLAVALGQQMTGSGVDAATVSGLRAAMALAKQGNTVSPAAAPQVQQTAQQAVQTKAANPKADVLNAAETLFVQHGMSLKTAKKRADIVSRLVAGEKVDDDEIRSLEPTNPKTQADFTALTGVQFPEGVNKSIEKLRATYRSAHEVAVQAAQVQAQDEVGAETEAAQETPVAAPTFDVGLYDTAGQMLMTPEQFATENQLAPEAVEEQYGRYLYENAAVEFQGQRMNLQQFREVVKQAPGGDQLTDDEIIEYFQRGLERDAEQRRHSVSGRAETAEQVGQAAENTRRAELEAQAKSIQETLHKLGLKTTVEVDFDSNLGDNAFYDSANNRIVFNGKQIANANAMVWTLGHELVHKITNNGTQNIEFVDAVISAFGNLNQQKVLGGQLKAWMDNVDGRTEELMSTYKRFLSERNRDTSVVTREYAQEELAGDLMREAFVNEGVLNALANDNPGVVYRAQRVLRDWFGKLRGNDVSEARKTLKTLSENFQTALKQSEAAPASYRTEAALTDDAGNLVAESDDQGYSRFSMSTYQDSGRDILTQWMARAVTNGDLTQEDADDIIDTMDLIYDTCEEYRDKYAPFSAWSDAKVVVNEQGKPVFSVVKKNGEYPMNLDFSLVCKKRRTLDAVLNELVRRGFADNVDLGQENIVKVNEIIRKYGFETACDLCFVDARRFRQADVADTFVKLYNDLVLSMVPKDSDLKPQYFNFGGSNLVAEDTAGIHELPDAELDFTHIDEVLKTYGEATVEAKVAQLLKTSPADRRLTMRGDFLSTRGFDAAYRENPRLMKLYNSKKGTGGPKAAVSDVQYLNEVLKSRTFNAEKAYAVGGVRIQSFSDYVPRMVFDYVQMIADLSAKKLPAQAYTKEELFVKQFGLTGMKINMSLIPKVVDGGIAPGLDANGDYAWADESFDFNEAKRIQRAEGYSRNCGTIAVGVSDEHIRTLMADPEIRMVIPYHKSGLNAIVAKMNKIDQFVNYEDFQNTRHENGTALDKKKDKKLLSEMPDFNTRMRELSDPRAAAEEYVRWCEEHDLLPKFDQFAYKQIDGIPVERDGQRVVDENYYKLLEDFTVYDNGQYIEQTGLTMTFPDETSAFGSMADLIKRGLEEDAVLEGKRTEKVGPIVDEIMRFSVAYEGTQDPALKNHLTTAKEMELQGKSAEQIRKDTGWWRNNKDGAWRFEIDDTQMRWKVKDISAVDPVSGIRLEDLISHDELFQSYPHMRDYKVVFDLEPTVDGGTGSHDGRTRTIQLEKNADLSNINVEKAIVHEMQHAVQHFERALANVIQSGFSPRDGYQVGFISAYRSIKGSMAFKAAPYKMKTWLIENEMARSGRKAGGDALLDKESAVLEVADQYYSSALGELEAEDAASRFEKRKLGYPVDAVTADYPGAHLKTQADTVREFKRVLKKLGWSGLDADRPAIYNQLVKDGVLREDKSGRAAPQTQGAESETELVAETQEESRPQTVTEQSNHQASEKSGASFVPEAAQARYSIVNPELSFADQVELAAQNKLNEFLAPGTSGLNPDTLTFSASYVTKEPNPLMQELGYGDLPLVTTQEHIRQMIGKREDASGKVIDEHNHQLAVEQVQRLPELLEKPAAVIRAKGRPESLIFVTTETDYKGRPIIVPIKANGIEVVYDGVSGPAHIITSMYGRDNFQKFFEDAVKAGQLVYYNEKRIDPMLTAPGYQSSGLLSGIDSDTIMGEVQPKVKDPGERKYSITPEFEKWYKEQYGEEDVTNAQLKRRLRTEERRAKQAEESAKAAEFKRVMDTQNGVTAWSIYHQKKMREQKRTYDAKLKAAHDEKIAAVRAAVTETKVIERAKAEVQHDADRMAERRNAAKRLRTQENAYSKKVEGLKENLKLKRNAAKATLRDKRLSDRKRAEIETEQGLVNTIRQSPPERTKVERLQESAQNLRTMGRAAYRNFVNQAEAIDRFSKRQVSDMRAGTLVNIAGGSASTIEAIFKNGLVNRAGDRIGDSMSEVFLCWDDAHKSVDENKQALLQDFMLHWHNIDRMSIETRAEARLETFELNNEWLRDMDPKELARLIAMTETEAKKLGKEAAQLKAFEYSRLVREYNDAKNKPIFADDKGNAVTAETSQKIVDKYLEENPWLLEKAKSIHEWWDLFMREWAVGDTISGAEYLRMRDTYPHYVPTYRTDKGGPGGANFVGLGGANVSKAVKRAKGSFAEVANIEDSFANMVSKIVKLNRVNELYMNIIDTAMLDEDGTFADLAAFDWDSSWQVGDYAEALKGDIEESVDEAETAGLEKVGDDYKLTAWRDGRKYTAFISEDLYLSIGGVTGHLANDLEQNLLKIGNILTGPMKTAITGINPMFAARNMARDLPTAVVNSISGMAFPKYWTRAAKEMAQNSEHWQHFQALGGTHATHYNTQSGAKQLTQSENLGKRALGKLGWFNEVTESQTRFAEYLATVDRLGDTYESRLQGIKNAAEVTVDFSRKGRYGKVINAWVPYWNPAVQGIDKVVRSVIDSPDGSAVWKQASKTLGRAAMTSVLFEAILQGFLHALDRDDEWEELDDRTKDTYYCIPLKDEKKFLKIPKNREWGAILGTPFMRMLEYANGRENPFENYIETAIEPNFLPPAIFRPDAGGGFSTDMIGFSQMNDLSKNEDFAGRTIVPYAYQQGSLSQQYDAETSWAAKKLGALFDWSPMQIDYIISDYFGDFGDLFQIATSEATWSGDRGVGEALLDVVKSPWVTDSRYSNAGVSKYYDTMDALKLVVNDKKNQLGNEAYKQTIEYQTQKAVTDLYGDQISELNRVVRELPDGDEKDAAKAQIVQLTSEALQYYEDCMAGRVNAPVLDAEYKDFNGTVSKELIRLDSLSSEYKFKPTGTPQKQYTDPRNKQREYILTDEQKDYFKELYRETYNEMFLQKIQTSRYMKAKDADKAAMLETLRDDVLDATKDEFFDWLRKSGARSTPKTKK